MSKEAAQRAMREARYAERMARAAAVRQAGGAPPATASGEPGALCGHRSMNGRTCTREQGHAAKNHRYG